jgi:hypothetical protein
VGNGIGVVATEIGDGVDGSVAGKRGDGGETGCKVDGYEGVVSN